MPTFTTTSRGATTSRKLVSIHGGPDGLRPDLDNYPINRAVEEFSKPGMGDPSMFGGQASLTVPTLISPAYPLDGGVHRIIIEGFATSPGTLFLETRSAAAPLWTLNDSETLLAGENVRGIATTVAAEVEYRVRIEFPGGLPSKARFFTQARP
jgi:hypothetical protein